MKAVPVTLNMKQNNFIKLVKAATNLDCMAEWRFHTSRKWRFDYAIPAAKVAVEVEGGVFTGGRHTTGAGFTADIEKYNTAESMGWHVLRITPDVLCAPVTIKLVADTCRAAMSYPNETVAATGVKLPGQWPNNVERR